MALLLLAFGNIIYCQRYLFCITAGYLSVFVTRARLALLPAHVSFSSDDVTGCRRAVAATGDEKCRQARHSLAKLSIPYTYRTVTARHRLPLATIGNGGCHKASTTLDGILRRFEPRY